MTFDFPHFGDRRGEATERFLLFVEQLEQAVKLLESGRVARQRMALVALDNLADGLLFHHLQTVFLAIGRKLVGERNSEPVPPSGNPYRGIAPRQSRTPAEYEKMNACPIAVA